MVWKFSVFVYNRSSPEKIFCVLMCAAFSMYCFLLSDYSFRFTVKLCLLYIFFVTDPRVNDWFLMSSPFYTLGICLSYVFIVKVLGPKLMENRKPFELKNVLIVYNLFQVIFSAWLFYEVSLF